MAGIAIEESVEVRSLEEVLEEWRSSEQVENGTPSTLPIYWNSDSNDDNGM